MKVGITVRDLAKIRKLPGFKQQLEDARYQRSRIVAVSCAKQTSLELKRQTLDRVTQAGLFSKLCQIIRNADVTTPEGKEDILSLGKTLIRDLFPREAMAKITTDVVDPLKTMQLEDLQAKLTDLEISNAQEVQRIATTNSTVAEYKLLESNGIDV